MANWLTRAELDQILDGMTGRDVFAAVPNGESEIAGTEIASNVFEGAAVRQGYGEGALDRVKPADAMYLAGKLAEVFQQTGPKGKRTARSQASPASGG